MPEKDNYYEYVRLVWKTKKRSNGSQSNTVFYFF